MRYVPVAYARDGVPGLSLTDQERVLGSASIPLTNAYRDVLNATQIRRRVPASLTQRARMLVERSGTTRELICVAELRCLGWNMADIARCLADAGRGGLDVHVVDLDQTFPASILNPGLLEALAKADEGWRRGQTEEGRSIAAVVNSAKAEQTRRAKLEVARQLWAKPRGEISGAKIAERVGLSLSSLNSWLGPRSRMRK